MPRRITPAGTFTINFQDEAHGTVSDFSVAAVSGPLGSVIHGLRIDIQFRADCKETTLSMGAADAMQLAEAIQTAVHRRDDVKK